MKYSILILLLFVVTSCNNSENGHRLKNISSTEPKDTFSYEQYILDDFFKRLAKDSGKDEINIGPIQLKSIPSKLFEETQAKIVIIDCIEWPCIELIPSEIEKLTNLEEIHLVKTSLKELPDNICKLKKLKVLNISGGRQLTHLPDCINELVNLEQINLWRNNLTTLPNTIVELKKLKQINLVENNFAEEERKRLKKLLPHCHIKFKY